MNKNKKIGLIIVGVLVLAGTFYGGMSYGKSQVATGVLGQRQNFGQNNGAGRGIKNGGEFTVGEIISKDTQSITVHLTTGGPGSQNTSTGGSKIIFIDSNTKISKSTNGTETDLMIGTPVSITGTTNTDGSITAQSVQIRQSDTLQKIH